MGKHCIGTNWEGNPCGAYAQVHSQYCFFHDPEKEEEKIEARSKAKTSSTKTKRVKVLRGELVELTGRAPEDYRIKELKLESVNDLVDYTILQMSRIEGRATDDHPLTLTEEAMLSKLTEFLLKLQIAQGLGARERVEEMEELIIELERKLLLPPKT